MSNSKVFGWSDTDASSTAVTDELSDRIDNLQFGAAAGVKKPIGGVSTDNALVLFSGTAGDQSKDSDITVDPATGDLKLPLLKRLVCDEIKSASPSLNLKLTSDTFVQCTVPLKTDSIQPDTTAYVAVGSSQLGVDAVMAIGGTTNTTYLNVDQSIQKLVGNGILQVGGSMQISPIFGGSNDYTFTTAALTALKPVVATAGLDVNTIRELTLNEGIVCEHYVSCAAGILTDTIGYVAANQTTITNDLEIDGACNVNGEFHVGTHLIPSESAFGGGDDHTEGMTVLNTVDDITFADITASIVDVLVSTPVFSSTLVGSTCYIGGSVKFHGIKTFTLAAWGAVDHENVVTEYWNGVLWAPFNIMVTKSSPPFDSRTNEIFAQVDNEHVRDGPMPGFAVSTINAVSAFWIRIRVAVAITLIPSVSLIKLGTNRIEIQGSGHIDYFGDARTTEALSFGLGVLESSNAPANSTDILISSKLDLKRKDNLFDPLIITRIGTNSFLPPNLDTSYGIKLTWAWSTSDPIVGGEMIHWCFRYGYSNDVVGASSNVYPLVGLEPVIGSNEQAITLISPVPLAINTQKNETITVQIPNMNCQPIGREPDILFFTLERIADGTGSDTFAGSVSLIQMKGIYVKWNAGGHIDLF